MRQIIILSLTILILAYLLRQCRKPSGWLGRFYLWTMNLNHSRLTDWGLSHVQIEKHYSMLDIGCGGGRTIKKLADLASEGKVCGVDYSKASVAAARSTNQKKIGSGKVEIRQSSVSKLPFADQTFDLVTAVETLYYWPNPLTDLQEVLRVLKPGGRMLVIA